MTTTPEKTAQRILVVDDEPSISELISTSLRFVGFDVRTAANGAEALRVAEDFKPHAMVLDVMLPDLDGFEVCKKIRNEGVDTGVLFLTAKDGMEDKVKGLTLTALSQRHRFSITSGNTISVATWELLKLIFHTFARRLIPLIHH